MSITVSTLGRVLYPPERFVDATISTIAAAGNIQPTPLNLQQIYARYGLVARLDEITTDQTASVNLITGADATTWPPNGTLSIAQRPLGTPGDEELPARTAVTLNLANTGDASTSAPVCADWGCWLWEPTVADKLLLGIPLSAAEQNLWNTRAPVGYVPQLYPDTIWEEEYRPGVVMEWAGTASVGTSSGTPVTSQSTAVAQVQTVPTGYFDAIVGIWVDASVGGTISRATQASNALLVNLDRDDDPQILQYPAGGVPWNPWGSVQHGTRPRSIALATWTVYLTTSAGVSNVPYRVLAQRCLIQPVHQARWGIDLATVPQDVIDQQQCGLI